jgi:cytochrome c-type biogenesis protein CcmH/NrfG
MMLSVFVLMAVATFGTLSWWLLRTKRVSVANWVGMAVVVAWLLVAAVKIYADRFGARDNVDEMLAVARGASWSANEQRAPAGDPVSNVAPVASLIGGLEARLAANPDDSKGWALLAQSYSFVGDGEKAEQAMARAIALGFAEADLRERVKLARRTATDDAPDARADAEG